MRVLLALSAALLLLSVGPGATASSSTPPRNGLIAIVGIDGLHLVDPASGTERLVPGSEETTEAVWSPDGTLLAVSAWQNERLGIYTMKPDGTDRQLILGDSDSPSWSPDGEWLVAVRETESANEVVVVRADGTDERVLQPAGLPAESYPTSPAWSPDGSQIAFVAGEGRVFLTSPDGEKLRSIDVKGAEHVSWSPDSSRLAIDRHVDTKAGVGAVVVVHELATGKQTELTGEQDGARASTWSPEGDQIAFLSLNEHAISATTTTTHSCGGEPFTSHLWTMSPDGTKAHKLVKGEYYGTPSWGRASEAVPAPAPVAKEQPAPAPDGQPAPSEPAPVPDEAPASPDTATPPAQPEPALAPDAPAKTSDLPSAKGLIAVRGSNGIYLVDPNSAAGHKVPETGDMIAPAWSPNGSLLAVERVGTDGSSSVYTIRPDGTQPQLVVKNASAPSWSAAGDTIFVARNECSTPCEPEDDEANVRYSVRPDGSDLQRVDLEQTDVNDPRELAWRSDGTPLSFFDEGSADAPGTFDTTAAAWSPDETRIAFIGALGPADDDEATGDAITAGLWIVSADGGTPQLLLEGASGWPSWPSDAR